MLTTFVVARPFGSGTEDTYAHPFVPGGLVGTAQYIAANIAGWPDGTMLLVWRCSAPDAGAARLSDPQPRNFYHVTVED